MEIQSVTNVIGWMYNALVSEHKTVYNYDQGNSVTVVERRSDHVQLYDATGKLEVYPSAGNTLDIKG